MHPIRSTTRSLSFLAIGAAVSYLFDPQAGRVRREHILGKLQRFSPSSPMPADAQRGVDPSGDTSPTIDEKVDPAIHSTSATELVVPDPASHGLGDDNGAAPTGDGAPAHVA